MIDLYLKTFFNPTAPCNFPGCEALRAQFNQELRATNSGKGCAACKRAAVRRKYKHILERRMGVTK